MNVHSWFGGRKMFAWQVIIAIASTALFCSKLSGAEWITVVLGSYCLLGVANVGQKALVSIGKIKVETEQTLAYNKEKEEGSD